MQKLTEEQRAKKCAKQAQFRKENAETLRVSARERARQRRSADPERARSVLRAWRAKNPDKLRAQNLKAAAVQKAKGVEFWRAVRATPEYKARHKAWRDLPENKILIRIRSRFKRSFKASFRGMLSSRSADFEAVNFLLWSAQVKGIDPRDGKNWHVDHVRPASAFEVGEGGINRPENLRWTSARDNLVKNARNPTTEEVAQARTHAKEWRKIFHGEKSE